VGAPTGQIDSLGGLDGAEALACSSQADRSSGIATNPCRTGFYCTSRWRVSFLTPSPHGCHGLYMTTVRSDVERAKARSRNGAWPGGLDLVEGRHDSAGSAHGDVDRQTALAGLLVLRQHVAAGLAHRLHRGIERHEVNTVAVQREAGRRHRG
jgi:hypothetical protein